MYVGRLLVVGPDVAAYRVSSRSFPNRHIVGRDGGTLTVVPTADAPETDNPYVSYNCLRTVGDPPDHRAVLGNGSHVDPVAEKVDLGYPPRDALASALLALDYEKDDYETPRIAGVVGAESHVGIVRRDGLHVERVDEPTLVATYEKDRPEAIDFGPIDAGDAGKGFDAGEVARRAYELPFEHPICAAGLVRTDEGLAVAVENRPK